MHEAFDAIAILEKLPLEIESITCYGDTLLVGTKVSTLSTRASFTLALPILISPSPSPSSHRPLPTCFPSPSVLVPLHHLSYSWLLVNFHCHAVF